MITGIILLLSGSVVFLTIQSVRESPPPAEAGTADPTAALYAENCAGCHGSTINVAPGTNLHNIISQGEHEGMPAWTADLDTDQIDALAGFILSPAGSELFTENCAACHETSELVASDPLELRKALDQGVSYAAHGEVEIPEWS